MDFADEMHLLIFVSYAHNVGAEHTRIAKCCFVIASQDVMGITHEEPPGAKVSKL